MRSQQPLTVTVPADVADMLRERVESGQSMSETEAIREGLLALQERDEEIEQWLRHDVLPTLDAHRSDPQRAETLAAARQRLNTAIDDIERNEFE
ncbi:ribbon-helix-helix domain-containing protein [Mangrovicella endophytica]|uniref:ribbon-helix-helix domain-containing protein n=1 Tax=Mangrovicella endophytica TaxID=2066697 RepID=UPI000C9E0179|nr:type II toxin-antitoxin system ParD family antitoxin [Mangrovicella endophytica]